MSRDLSAPLRRPLVGIGSALYYYGSGAFTRILGELTTLMHEESYARLSDFRGCAHV